MNRALAAIGLVLALGNVECAPVPLGDGPRRVVVRELTEDVIVPTYEDVATRVHELDTAIAAFVATPDAATLDAAQAAWRAARVPWKQADAFAFGPADTLRLGVAIDQNPVDTTKVDEELAGTAELTAAYVATIGANRKGFHALEYLLFAGDDGDDDAAVLAAFTSDPLAARRRAFAPALAENLATSADALRDAWATAADAYAVVLTDPGIDNATYPTIKSAVDALVNESLYLAELVADSRIGKPLGLASGGEPQPALEESGPSDNSIADITATLESIAHVYSGSREPDLAAPSSAGIGVLVGKLAPATDRDVRAALVAALTAVAAIPRPFKRAVAEHRDAVQAAYDAIKELKSLIATEVVAALGATLKFNDNDGD